MKKFVIFLSAIAMLGCLAGCGYTQTVSEPEETSIVVKTEEAKELPAGTSIKDNSNGAPVNYMDEIKAEIHDELFRDETEETLDIVNRIFKHLDIETISSSVNGEDAVVLMNVTTINAGTAWVIGLEKYAILCAENLFAETYADDATLYGCYLEEFEKAVRKAEYITIPVEVEMEYKHQRWEWDLDDDVVNAITGHLLAAIEGDINSSNIVVIPETDVETTPPVGDNIIPPAETDSEADEPEQNFITTGMKNAAETAKQRLEWWTYSRVELKQSLERDGYTEAEIEYALTSVGY